MAVAPVITQQPCGSPPGLEYLSVLDQVVIKQEVSLLEVVLPFEASNKYAVANNQGQRVYLAAEQSNFLCRQCCGPRRPFVLKVCDNIGVPILHVERPCNCGAFYPNCPCCSDSIIVNTELGEHMGEVERKCNPCYPGYRVLDREHRHVLSLRGPCCCQMMLQQCCCQPQPFELLDTQDRVLGQVAKQFSGALKELFTDADVFAATFPMDLDVKLKATLLGAVFLIDFNFFEKQNTSSAN